MPDTRPGLDALRERVIREITVAPGWNKPDATALVDELLAAADWTIKRLTRALRVASHTPHDQAGGLDPDGGFPVCSVCGAIQTDATGDSRPDHRPANMDDPLDAAWEAFVTDLHLDDSDYDNLTWGASRSFDEPSWTNWVAQQVQAVLDAGSAAAPKEEPR